MKRRFSGSSSVRKLAKHNNSLWLLTDSIDVLTYLRDGLIDVFEGHRMSWIASRKLRIWTLLKKIVRTSISDRKCVDLYTSSSYSYYLSSGTESLYLNLRHLHWFPRSPSHRQVHRLLGNLADLYNQFLPLFHSSLQSKLPIRRIDRYRRVDPEKTFVIVQLDM